MLERDITIDAILASYISNSIGFSLICIHDLVDFNEHRGLPAIAPQYEVPATQPDGSIKKVQMISLSFRSNYRNGPVIFKNEVSCDLTFGGKLRHVIIPFDAIVGVFLTDKPGLQIEISLISETPIKADPPSQKKPTLRLVK